MPGSSPVSEASVPYSGWDPTPPRPSTISYELTDISCNDQDVAKAPPRRGRKRAASESPTAERATKRTQKEDLKKQVKKDGTTKQVKKDEPKKHAKKNEPKKKLNNDASVKGKRLTNASTNHSEQTTGMRQKTIIGFLTYSNITSFDGIALTSDQSSILRSISAGDNVFITGAAGSGKSVVLRAAINRLFQIHSHSIVAVVAPTGIAACLLSGTTIHSWAGITPGDTTKELMLSKITRIPAVVSRWKNTSVLVIDEVSMLHPTLFDNLEAVARKLRSSQEPFGGIQLILAGDFLQLSPVKSGGRFLFEAKMWKLIRKKFLLKTVHRQRDEDFTFLLNEIRRGIVSHDTAYKLTKCSRPLKAGLIKPVHLFGTRSEVAHANAEELKCLKGVSTKYMSIDGGDAEEEKRKSLLDTFMSVEELELKVGAQVMLIKNTNFGPVNGTMGVVKEFMTVNYWKEQTNEREDVDDDELQSGNVERMTSPVNKDDVGMYPVVTFTIIEGDKGKKLMDVLVTPHLFKLEIRHGRKMVVEAQREQIPLILGWAITIHKSQGQAISPLCVHLEKANQEGQVYVALSRATSLQELQVLGFDEKRVKADRKALDFMKNTTWEPSS